MGCNSSKPEAQEPFSPLEALRQTGDQCSDDGVTIPPTGEHTHTVIMLHGLYGCGRNYVVPLKKAPLPPLPIANHDLPALVKGVAGVNADGIKYIFPTAEQIDLFWDGPSKPASETARAWYTYYTNFDGKSFSDDDVVNREQFYESVAMLVNMVNEEAEKLGGDASKVIIGGYSQGGTIAASAAVQLKPSFKHGLPKALIAIDTLPMAFAQVNINKHEGDGEPALVDPNATAIKVFYFVGEKDNTYPVANQDQAWARFKNAGFSVTRHGQPGVRHEFALQKGGLTQTAKWIAEEFFGR